MYFFTIVFVFVFLQDSICSFREEREREGREGRERALLFPAASDSTDIDSQQSWWEEVSLNTFENQIHLKIEINFGKQKNILFWSYGFHWHRFTAICNLNEWIWTILERIVWNTFWKTTHLLFPAVLKIVHRLK